MLIRAYIDTSFLLSIIFEDENYKKSVTCWNSLGALYSSVLLEIEARINLYKHSIRIDDRKWTREKEKQLSDMLENINRRAVDEEIVSEVKNYDQLKHARSLDGIHLATANILNKLMDAPLLLCSYEKRMMEIGGRIGLMV